MFNVQTFCKFPAINRLKFPMLRPSAIRLRERTLRLISESQRRQAEEKLRKENLKKTRNRAFATLIGNQSGTCQIHKFIFQTIFLIRSYRTDIFGRQKRRHRIYRSLFHESG